VRGRELINVLVRARPRIWGALPWNCPETRNEWRGYYPARAARKVWLRSCPETNKVRGRGNIPHVTENYKVSRLNSAKSPYKFVARFVRNRVYWLVCCGVIGAVSYRVIGHGSYQKRPLACSSLFCSNPLLCWPDSEHVFWVLFTFPGDLGLPWFRKILSGSAVVLPQL
jgi:hypothetical protein